MVDRIIFVCILILAGFYYYGTGQIRSLDFGDPLGPRAFPYLLEVGLLIAAALLFGEIVRAKKQEPSGAPAGEKQEVRHLLIIGAVVVWTCVYIASFETLGYVVATTIYLFTLMAFFNRGKWVANGLTPILFCIGTYLLFSAGLGVQLPKGLLKFIPY